MKIKDVIKLGYFALNAKADNLKEEKKELKEVVLFLNNLKKWAKGKDLASKIEDYQEDLKIIEIEHAEEKDGFLIMDDQGRYRYSKKGHIDMMKAKKEFYNKESGIEFPNVELTEKSKSFIPNDITRLFE